MYGIQRPRLCEGGEIEEQMFNLAQKFNRIPMLKLGTLVPLLQTHVVGMCLRLVVFAIFQLSATLF